METFRNMEIVLMLSFGLVCAAACFERPEVRRAPDADRALAVPVEAMQVVVITGKRLSAAEKRAFDAQARSG